MRVIQEFDIDDSAYLRKIGGMIQATKELEKVSSNLKAQTVGTFARNFQTVEKSLSALDDRKFNSIVKGLDQIQKQLLKLNPTVKTTKGLFSDLNTEINRTNIQISNLSRNIDGYIRKLKELDTQQNKLKKSISDTDSAGQKFNSRTKESTGLFGSMLGSVQRLIPFMGALFVLDRVQAFFSELYRVNRQFELFELKARSALDGSKTAVEEYFQALKRIDIKSLFDIEELETGLVKLLNRRVRLTEQELQSLANTAQAVGTRGAQSFNQIVEALLDAQVGQFRRLEELGVGVDATGEKLKLTFAGVTTEVDKGSQAVVRYILNLDKVNGAYRTANEAANTLEGRVSSLKTEFDELLRDIYKSGGDTVFDFLIDRASDLIKVVRNAATIITNLLKVTGLPQIVSSISEFNQGVISEQEQKRLAAENGFRFRFDFDEFKKDLNTNIKAANEGFVANFRSIDMFGDAFFNPAKIKDNKELKRFADETKKLIDAAVKAGVNSGKDFDLLTKNYGAILQEVEARRSASELNKGKIEEELKDAAEQSERELDLRNRQKENILRLDREEKLTRLQLQKEFMSERLRFEKEGSEKYLKLKEEIALKEIEIDEMRAKNDIRQKLFEKSGTLTKNAKGNYEMVYTEPTQQQIDAEFRKKQSENEFSLFEFFELRRRAVSELTTREINQNAQDELEKKQSLYEQLLDIVSTTGDAEIRAITSKYNRISKVIKDFQEKTLTPQERTFIQDTKFKIEALEQFELQLLQVKRSQEGLLESGRASVTREQGESTYRFARRQNIAGLESQRTGLIELRNQAAQSSIARGIGDMPQVKEIIRQIDSDIQQISDRIKQETEKAKSNFKPSQGLLLKAFGIDQEDPQAGEFLNMLQQAFDKATDIYFDYIQSVINLEKAKEEQYDKNISNLEKRLERETELKKKGLGNNYDAIKADIARQEELKRQSTQRQIALQKQQIISNAILQSSTLAASAMNIIFAKSPIPGGVFLAAIEIASMLGLAATTIAQIKTLEKFEVGGEIGGKRHSQGGTVVEAEQGEFIVRRNSYQPNKRLIQNINNLNRGVTSGDLSKIFKGTNILPSIDDFNTLKVEYHIHQDSNTRELAAMRREISTLKNTFEKVVENTARIPKSQTYTTPSGTLVKVSGDTTIEYVNSKDNV